MDSGAAGPHPPPLCSRQRRAAASSSPASRLPQEPRLLVAQQHRQAQQQPQPRPHQGRPQGHPQLLDQGHGAPHSGHRLPTRRLAGPPPVEGAARTAAGRPSTAGGAALPPHHGPADGMPDSARLRLLPRSGPRGPAATARSPAAPASSAAEPTRSRHAGASPRPATTPPPAAPTRPASPPPAPARPQRSPWSTRCSTARATQALGTLSAQPCRPSASRWRCRPSSAPRRRPASAGSDRATLLSCTNTFLDAVDAARRAAIGLIPFDSG